MKKTTDETMLSPSEAAKILMVSPITLRQWAQRGLLPAFTTLGGHRRFRLQDIENFLEKNNSITNTAPAKEVKILIIDDDENILRFLGFMFSDKSQKTVLVETASNGFDGGSKVHSFKPNFLLLDLRMNGMDGFEVCQNVKQDKTTSDIRILTMTGYPSKENTDRIISLGAEACFPKPLDIDALLLHMELITKGTSDLK